VATCGCQQPCLRPRWRLRAASGSSRSFRSQALPVLASLGPRFVASNSLTLVRKLSAVGRLVGGGIRRLLPSQRWTGHFFVLACAAGAADGRVGCGGAGGGARRSGVGGLLGGVHCRPRRGRHPAPPVAGHDHTGKSEVERRRFDPTQRGLRCGMVMQMGAWEAAPLLAGLYEFAKGEVAEPHLMSPGQLLSS